MGLNRLISVLMLSTALLNQSMHTAMPDKHVDGKLFLVNREYMVSEAFVPSVRKVIAAGMSQSMRDDAAQALEEMFATAKQEGIRLEVVSGYRSYSKQTTIYNRKVKRTGSKKEADELVARPGASEHQLGLAMDVGAKGNSSLTASFGRTKEGKWLRENAHRFGFIIRYLEGYEEITGYSYEPWHVRYVGKELSEQIYRTGLPLETFMNHYKMEVYDYLIHQE